MYLKLLICHECFQNASLFATEAEGGVGILFFYMVQYLTQGLDTNRAGCKIHIIWTSVVSLWYCTIWKIFYMFIYKGQSKAKQRNAIIDSAG